MEPHAEQDTPLVTMVIITGKSPDRAPLAMAAVNSCLKQTYPRIEVLVINDGEPLRLRPPVREIMIEKKLTLGELRNRALYFARGSWIAQQDDDDYSHPERVAYMMGHRRPGHADLAHPAGPQLLGPDLRARAQQHRGRHPVGGVEQQL